MPVEYAYLMASLPMLAIGKDIPMSSADFLASSTPLLKQEDAQGLKSAMEGRFHEVKHPAARRYAAAEVQLRDAVARAGGQNGRRPSSIPEAVCRVGRPR